ncbi:ceramidase [Umbelopsis sp. PMI_123]|nr:ceramidase [Umbelopsis sp. PMI_123]
MSSSSNVGYWGPVTSSVDWCEENYTHSYYVAEWWNSISSVAMIVQGLLGMYLHQNTLGNKITFSYFLTVIVGIGSTMFHATLLHEYQMWDELPMVWNACYLLWVLLDERGLAKRWVSVSIAAYCAVFSYLCHVAQGSAQFYTFQASFGLMMWACFYLVWKMYIRTTDQSVRGLYKQGATLLIAAISVWLFDSNLCFVYQYLPNPQLHAFWHVLMSTSLHYFYVACGYSSNLAVGAKRIQYLFGLVPYLTVSGPELKKQH